MMCIDLSASGYRAPVADLQKSARTVQNAARPNPCIPADLDLAPHEHIVVHRRALAEAVSGRTICTLGKEIANRHPSIEFSLFARCNNPQKLSNEREPFVDAFFGQSFIEA